MRGQGSRPGGRCGRSAAALLVAVACVWGRPARSADWVVRSESTAAFQDLMAWPVGFDDPRRLPRQRLYEAVSLFGNDLLEGRDLDLTVGFRAGTDLGWRAGEPEALDGVDRWELDLLVAHLRWRDPAGRSALTLGRFLRLDPVAFRAVDGAEGRLAWGWLRLLAWGGLQVQDTSPLGAAAFELDGVRGSEDALGDRVGSAWPFVLTEAQDAPAPTLGAGVGLAPWAGTGLEGGWRRTWSDGHLDEDRGWLRAWTRRGPWTGDGLVEWDAFGQRVSFAQASVTRDLGRHLEAGLGWDRVVPTWDADSIWNLFAVGPMDEAALVLRVRAAGPWSGQLRLRARRTLDPVLGSGETALGGTATVDWRPSPRRGLGGSLWLLEGGGGGQRTAWLWGRWPLGARLDVEAQVAGGWVDSDARDRADDRTLGGRLGAGWWVGRGVRLSLVLEESLSRKGEADTRGWARLEVEVGR